ncbi:MAG: hypothetical protein A2Z03_00760 [Chloroflexi bacterium RBG_16_56_8]|nr:MAG: hypothetical protein A2Z03_00760 [Chloroflexi bacterium RBG_16_56_8]
MPLLPVDYLRHILDETIFIQDQAKGLTKERLLQDAMAKRGFVRSIEIIGEAAKQVPPDFRQKYTQVDWRAIAGMRDRLVHDYFGIDYDIVWDVIVNKVPALKQEIERIIEIESGS